MKGSVFRALGMLVMCVSPAQGVVFVELHDDLAATIQIHSRTRNINGSRMVILLFAYANCCLGGVLRLKSACCLMY
jgi:hypothetical protein